MEPNNAEIIQDQTERCALLKRQLTNALALNMFSINTFASPRAILGSYAYHLRFAPSVSVDRVGDLLQYLIQNYDTLVHNPTFIAKEPPLGIFFFMDYDLFDVNKAPQQNIILTSI